jgi:hypothetical protein
MNRTPASASNRQTFTLSKWIKRGTLGTTGYVFGAEVGGSGSYLYFTSSDTLQFYDYSGGVFQFQLITTQVFRDPSAWYHIVVVSDTTQATTANRIKIYVNGVQITAFSTATYPSQNYNNSSINNNNIHYVGYPSSMMDGYRAEFNFVDGQALTPSSFGSTNALTGVWQPAKYTGTYGTNGFYLSFTNTTSTTTLGYDSSGNGNNWTTNNFSLTAGATYDSMTDVPTLTSATTANYCTGNPLNNSTTLTNGNLSVSAGAFQGVCATFGTPSTGSWYWETTVTTNSSGNSLLGMIAINQASSVRDLGAAGIRVMARSDGAILVDGTTPQTGLGAWSSGDVFACAYNSSTNSFQFYRNNATYGTSITPTAGYSWYPYCGSTGNTSVFNWNFGQQGFTYTPPTGYVALNTYNLPTSTIVQGNKYMDATLYAGAGTTQNVVNTAGFKPDLFWLKNRTTTNSHYLYDSNRGVLISLSSNQTQAEQNIAQTLTSFNSNGATLGTIGGGINGSGNNFVGWQWQAGQGTNASNTSGSITTTVSASPTAGFSIIKYAGNNSSGSATLGHGLGVAPVFMIFKNRDQTGDWCVYHQNMNATPQNYYAQLNLSNASGANSTIWNNTAPTSSVVSVGSYLNGNTINYIGYAWSEIAGFSKFGSYTGNGSSDGPFLYLGFRPKYMMFKRLDAANDWYIWDSVRGAYNYNNATLYADLDNGEGSGNAGNNMTFVSNGCKVSGTLDQINASGGTYIYMAWAENPFKNSLAR